MDKRNELLEGPIGKSLFTLAIPIVLANILQAGYQLTDAFWVGRLGGDAVAAVSIAGPINFLTIALGVGFAVAGSTLIAQYYGAKNDKMVAHVSAQTLLAITAISILLGTIGYVFAPIFLDWMNVAPEVYQGALGFLRVSFVGILPNFFFFMFQSIMRGIGKPKLPVFIVLGTVFLNFVLDPLFIFGWGPFPILGVMGAAIATLGTQTVASLIALWILTRGEHGVHIHWSDFRFDFAFIKKSFLLGLPASIEQSARAFGLIVLTFLIATFGTTALAAYGAGSNIFQVVLIPALGLSMAISALVGQNIGAGNMERAAKAGRFGAWLGFWIFSGLGILVFIFAEPLLRFFVPADSAVIAEGANYLRIASLSWGFLGAQLALVGVLRAAGNMIASMILALLSQWILLFPSAYFLSKHTPLGTSGLWWGFFISNVLITAITLPWYRRGDWKKNKLISSEDQLQDQVSDEIIIEEGVH